jgi:site-specific DNA recombinase
MRNDTIKAAGYIRVSQERSARNGYGLQAQESAIRKHVSYKDWKLVEIYREEGVSGYKRERPELNRLLEDARTGKFDVVVFPSIDRVGRSVKDVIEIDSFLQKQNIDTVFLREGIDTSTPTGALYRNIMSSIAEFEGKLIYERLSKGKRAKASSGGYVGGWLPYGYGLDEGNIVVIKEEAEVVEQIFKWRAEGMTLQQICDKLNTDKVKTQRNGSWRISTIRGILRRRFYTGRVKFEGTFIRAQHDAIVSDLMFRKVNNSVKNKILLGS